MGLDALFSPRAVAVVGASNRELTIGYRIIENLLGFGYTGPIYPVNPKADEVRGLKAYPTILDAPDPVDVAHIVIKNTLVARCVEDCAAKGVRAVIVNTAGFREIGPEGAAQEDELVAIARSTGIRVFGPNCQGIINSDPAVRAYCNFTFTRPAPGHVSIVAQSGGVGEVIHQRITELGVGVRMYASNGNACDVSIPEIVRYYGADDQTKVVVVHIESLANAREFMETAAEVARHKPVLAMKVGRTAEGAQAVASHTGRLVERLPVMDLVFEKAGVVAFRTIDDLCQATVGFASQPVPAGNRVGMIANTGGPAVIATDELIEGGMSMPPLSEETQEVLRAKLYPEASVRNPIDVLATAGPQHFAASMDALLDDQGIDAIFLNFITPFFVDTLGVAREIAEANRRSHKPIVATVMTQKATWGETLKIIRDAGVPTFDMPETGARVLVAMGRYAMLRNRPSETPARFSDVDAAQARSIIEAACRDGGTHLRADAAWGLLHCYGLPVASFRMADNADECLAAADAVGYPVVLKVDAESIVHKTESGGVITNIANRDALRRHVAALGDRFAQVSPRFLVQRHLPPGREVIVGAKQVAGLGPVIMFGLGGIYVQVLGDVSFQVTPVTQREARRMIEAVHAFPLLVGARGEPSVDIEALVQIIQRVSQMLADLPEIDELDLNPVFAFPEGAIAADVRVAVRRPSRPTSA